MSDALPKEDQAEQDQASGHDQPSAAKFGTFLGVFTPSVLTILGVMMYLRFGWVVGNVGTPIALVIVLMASSITFVTGLSASAIATNMHVGVGGEYYMVSRSLGPELGGAIGIPLFLCRTLSLTLYSFGLTESFAFLWPPSWGPPPLQLLTVGVIIVITGVAGKSAALSLKLQLPIMVAVFLSVVALFGGVLQGGLSAPEMVPHYQRSAAGGFWYVFAVFFPAVTGFTAGIGMSGDLADPKRSIPRGTMLAVVVGTISYLLILVLLGSSAQLGGDDLARIDPNAPPIWTKVALFGFWLVYPGMWGAILSSAFGSALGGPRVLQALANDGLVPRLLAHTSRTGQPTIATWVTGVIAISAVALGDLNAVGRWVTIFFLTLYVIINFSAAIEQIVRNPSYRPTVRVPWIVSLAGSGGALVVMFLINQAACVAAISLEVLIYLILRRRSLQTGWGDVRAGFWTALARYSLLRLRQHKPDARNWRPQILLFNANPASRMGLVRMASWFNQSRGIVTVCRLVEGNLDEEAPKLQTRLQKMDEALYREGLVAFTEVDVVPNFEAGIVSIAQANGFAGLQSNTLMFGWPNSDEGLARLLRVTRTAAAIEKSIVLARLSDSGGPKSHSDIDVWWRGMQHNGDLMLLLAYLLSLNQKWRGARITVRTLIEKEEDRQQTEEKLAELIRDVRIEATADVLVRAPDRSLQESMHAASRKADVVFLGLPLPEEGEEQAYAERLGTMAQGFHSTVFVRNNTGFAGELI
ncbi:MAG: amino acid permease [Deltaproteobacteria bacterium]|nr:amino acid permease [Deltaproteobacteria bacterium]